MAVANFADQKRPAFHFGNGKKDDEKLAAQDGVNWPQVVSGDQHAAEASEDLADVPRQRIQVAQVRCDTRVAFAVRFLTAAAIAP